MTGLGRTGPRFGSEGGRRSPPPATEGIPDIPTEPNRADGLGRPRRGHTRAALSAVQAHRGTEGSNPFPSSGESDANSAQSWPHVALVLLAALGFEDPGSSVAFSCGNRSLKAIEQRRVSRRRSAQAHTAGVDRQIPLGIRTWLRSHASFAKSQGWRQEPTERGSALAQYHLTTTRVPIMRNQPLRSDAPRCGWQTIATEVPAQKGSSSSSQNAT
jgi:hypothetical protein